MTPSPKDEASNPPGGGNTRSPLVCFCRRVTEAELREAMDRDARSVEDLVERTSAGTGCGTCRFDLERMIRERSAGETEGSAQPLLLVLVAGLLALVGTSCGHERGSAGSQEPGATGQQSANADTAAWPDSGDAPPVALSTAASGILTGRLIDALGQPIASASVLRLAPGMRSGARASWSDSRGGFRIAGVFRGDLILILADGYEPRLLTASGPDTGTVELRSGPPLRVEVRSGLERRVLPEARIEFRPAVVDTRLGPVAAKELTRTALTDANGLGFLRGLFPLAGILRVEAPGCETWERTITPDEREQGIDVVLSAGRSVSGQLLDASGQAVSGAWIEVAPREGGSTIRDETLIDGSFFCTGAPEGPLEIAALVEGVTIPLGDWEPARTKTLRLPALQRTVGRVVDAGGVPIASASVTRIARSGRRSRRVSTRGRFTFEGLPEGRIALRATSKGFVPALHIVQEPTNGPIELRLARARTAVGRVVDAAGRPVANASVRLVDAAGPALNGDWATEDWTITRTRPDGSFAVSWALPAESARVLVEPVDGPASLGPLVHSSSSEKTGPSGQTGPSGATGSRPEPGSLGIDCGTIRVPLPGKLLVTLDQPTAAGTTLRLLQMPDDSGETRPSRILDRSDRDSWTSGPIAPGTYRLLRTPGPFERSEPLPPISIQVRAGIETTLSLSLDREPTLDERTLEPSTETDSGETFR